MYLDQNNGYQPILSQDSAPGILMAMGKLLDKKFVFFGEHCGCCYGNAKQWHYSVQLVLGSGNIGTHLTKNISELRLYMSTNGGVSWAELAASGYKEFQLLDFGVFMAYTDKNKQTNTVWWVIHVCVLKLTS